MNGPAPGQPIRVRVASAGTGKTTVLVARYLELIGSGTPLRRIAGATFTRAAAEELRQRVADGIQQLLRSGHYLDLVELHELQREAFSEAERELPGALLSTISGLMIRFLRLVAPQLGLDPEFQLMDEHDARVYFEEEFRSQALVTGTELEEGMLRQAMALFERRSLALAFSAGDDASGVLIEQFTRAMAAYNQRLGSHLLGPADVERHAMRLLELPNALKRIGSRYSHVLIDEFQDVNPLQGRFFMALSRTGLQVEAVGDPKQSIYAFRDADVEVFRAALADGERLPDLTGTRRHAAAITRFLNHATSVMAQADLGFSEAEAPVVQQAGSQADKEGAVRIHWVTGQAGIGLLRNQEARLLAELLQQAHEEGTPWEDMAVLARTHGSLETARKALLAAHIPAVLGSGRGFFQRLEIRDVASALKSGVSASGPAFAAWLRSPYAQLNLADMQEVLRSEDRHGSLRAIDPHLASSLTRLHELVMEPPLKALQGVLREPIARGRPIGDWLSARQRANLDALLLRVARRPPADLELLLAEIDRHASSRIAEVPESGGGVSLVTVHYAKGLEWPLTAVFDAGRGDRNDLPELLVRRTDGAVALPGSPLYQDLAEGQRERDRLEQYRQFYVAVSRPRDRLIVTGSVKGRSATGWASLLAHLGLGADQTGQRPAGVSIRQYGFDREAARPLPETRPETVARPAADWTTAGFGRGRFQPVMSPSSLQPTGHDQPEPGLVTGTGVPEELPTAAQGGLQEADTVVSLAAATGTLLHAGIALGWQAGDPQLEPDLLAQEVMFAFTDAERREIVAQVRELLEAYGSMLGSELPALARRERDEAELPVALPFAGTVWQGTIDRLYQVDGTWFLDDYKTDRQVEPGRYLGQLAIYWLASRMALQVEPRVRLVWLRHGTVTDVSAHELQAELDALAAGAQ